MFDKSTDAKKAGWFSRRHRSNGAHILARQRYLNRREGRPTQRWDADNKRWIHSGA